MEQYRRQTDVRYYDLPTENYKSKLYYERTHLAKPIYRGLFRDKPNTVTSYHPSAIENKPKGFHGRLYYEQENPQFKYNDRPKNDLYWLENQPYKPVYAKENNLISRNDEIRMPEISTSIVRREGNKTPSIRQCSSRGMNPVEDSHVVRESKGCIHSWNHSNEELLQSYCKPSSAGGTMSNRLTQDGPGYL